ncbi:MAG: phosphatidylserine decarboxylase family protein [Deltaproteobacteria bacterium]|nr:phosphatidylserine decarboxylase family protein [Deltaproteobacteria bacterium]
MPLSEKSKKRIHNKWPVAREGLPFILIGMAFFLIFLFIGILPLIFLFGILCLFTIFFFRDPERTHDVDKDAVLTPADGKVIGIHHLKGSDNPLGKPSLKLSVFMSLFNVHVNRMPLKGKILNISHYPGRFFSAHLDKASEQNENNRVTLQTEDGQTVVIVQIAGLIARRIACWIGEGDTVTAGQRYGLIRFGSRLDIYLPIETRVVTEMNHYVKAGKTVLGYLS